MSFREDELLWRRMFVVFATAMAFLSWVSPIHWGPVPLSGHHLASALALGLMMICGRVVATLRWVLYWAGLTSALVAIYQVTGICTWGAHIHALCSTDQAHGFLGQRNLLASLMVISIWVCLIETTRSNRSTAQQLLDAFSLVVLSTACALTASRVGLLNLSLCTLIWWRVSCRAAQQRSALCSVMLVAATYGIVSAWMGWHSGAGSSDALAVWQRISDESAYSRLALWGNVVELIGQSPWTGHGWRSLAYLHYSTDFSGPRFMEMLDNAHNLPLHLAVELGIPVALAFCALVCWGVWRARPWAEQRWDRQMAWIILLVIGIHSMVEYPLWYGPFFMTTLCAIAILSGDTWQKWYSALAKSTRSAINLGVKLLAVALLAAVAYVAWNYHRVSQIYLPPEQRSSAYAQDPLAAAQRSVLFESHAQFAELQITPLTQASAPRILELSLHLVKWSPEPRIIEKLIESAVMLGQDDVAQFHIRRYRIAYPLAYAKWSQSLSMDGKGS
jgi:O-antigen ligase